MSSVVSASEDSAQEEVSLALAIGVSVVSFLVALITGMMQDGLTWSTLHVFLGHASTVSEVYVPQAVGGSLAIPLLVVAASSFFKSWCNPNTRRRIFIWFGVFIIAINLMGPLLNQAGSRL